MNIYDGVENPIRGVCLSDKLNTYVHNVCSVFEDIS